MSPTTLNYFVSSLLRATGKNFSMALTESGDVYSWGAGGALQLGHSSKLNEEIPRMVEALRDVSTAHETLVISRRPAHHMPCDQYYRFVDWVLGPVLSTRQW